MTNGNKGFQGVGLIVGGDREPWQTEEWSATLNSCFVQIFLCNCLLSIFYHLVDRVHDAGAACFDLFHLIGQLARGLDKDPRDLLGKQKQLTTCLCYIRKWFMWRWDEKRCRLTPIPWNSCCQILKPTGSFSSLFLIAMQYLKVGKMSIDDKLQNDILGQKQTRG